MESNPMTQPHKTLAECKDEVAGNFKSPNYSNWNEMKSFYLSNNLGIELLEDCIDKASELFYSDQNKWFYCAEWNNTGYVCEDGPCNRCSQFVKKDSVSSDVEQAAKDYIEEYYTENNHQNEFLDMCVTQFSPHFIAGAKWQSTQQPAITTLQQANAELQQELDAIKKQRQDDMTLAKSAADRVAELEKQNAELIKSCAIDIQFLKGWIKRFDHLTGFEHLVVEMKDTLREKKRIVKSHESNKQP